MKQKEVFRGVPGMLRPFKEYLESMQLKSGDQIVYYGCPGTCTPFVELLGFATRSLGLQQVFVPFVDESKARTITLVADVGMQASASAGIEQPKVLVIMGGLSMPNVPISAAQVKAVINKHPDATRIGVCFMNMFEKTGWLKELDFDLLIDAVIDPVEVWK
ncbi:MAG TPA: DUF2124 domain-containing protein [Methanoregulaceae archaeon]|nr:DUF2124 domain-containing protein [Methanoregulaceae archaeon]